MIFEQRMLLLNEYFSYAKRQDKFLVYIEEDVTLEFNPQSFCILEQDPIETKDYMTAWISLDQYDSKLIIDGKKYDTHIGEINLQIGDTMRREDLHIQVLDRIQDVFVATLSSPSSIASLTSFEMSDIILNEDTTVLCNLYERIKLYDEMFSLLSVRLRDEKVYLNFWNEVEYFLYKKVRNRLNKRNHLHSSISDFLFKCNSLYEFMYATDQGFILGDDKKVYPLVMYFENNKYKKMTERHPFYLEYRLMKELML